MMHMTFYWGKNVTLLFDSWVTTTWTGYLLTLLAVFLVSALYQYLEDRRIKFKTVSLSKKEISSSPPTIESPLLLGSVPRSRISARFVVAVLFGINSALGYMLMLAVMSFNWGVFLAVVFGLLVGYLVFRSDDVEDLIGVENPCACS